MKLDKFQSQIFFTTVRITIPDNQGEGASIGTGFIYSTPLPNDPKNRSITLLISNKHVFGNPNNKIIINFHKKNSETFAPLLGEAVVLEQENFSNNYFSHPSDEIDLACMNVSFIEREENNIYHKSLHPNFFANFNENEILPGSDILFIGYPENRFDTTHNLPILRKGVIATIPAVDFNGKKQFIIDAQVLPGSSGSPVFVIAKNKYKLAGVVSATMIKHQKLTTLPVNYDFGIQQTLGLGIVLKKVLVEELIKSVVDKVEKSIKEKEIKNL